MRSDVLGKHHHNSERFCGRTDPGRTACGKLALACSSLRGQNSISYRRRPTTALWSSGSAHGATFQVSGGPSSACSSSSRCSRAFWRTRSSSHRSQENGYAWMRGGIRHRSAVGPAPRRPAWPPTGRLLRSCWICLSILRDRLPVEASLAQAPWAERSPGMQRAGCLAASAYRSGHRCEPDRRCCLAPARPPCRG